MSWKDELGNLRDEINKVTIEIVRLCGERFSLARKIAEIKVQRGLSIEDLRVEEDLKREVLEKCRLSGVDAEFGVELLNLLLEESKRVQRDLVVQGKTDK